MGKIAIRLDAGSSIGLGHFIRCAALADALAKLDKHEIRFICRNRLNIKIPFPVLYLKKEYVTAPGVYDFPSIIDEIPEIEQLFREENIDCLIVDHYGAKDDYFFSLREKTKSMLVCVDDSLRRNIPVDVIINGNIYGTDASYADIPLQLLGKEYTLMRPEFCNVPKKEIKAEVKKIYITSGGADPLSFCSTISNTLLVFFPQLEIHVIVGKDFTTEYIKKLKKKKIILHQNASMKECMMDADFYISGAGSTLYELAVCGVPSISYIFEEDQKLVADYLHAMGTTYVCGWFRQYEEEKFVCLCNQFFWGKKRRTLMSMSGQRNINSAGAENAARQLQKYLDALEE